MSRVGEVSIRLKLAASERERAEETRRHVETVVIRQAVEELERLVHDRFGAQAIVRVRHLSFRWRVAREDLADPATALVMAEDLAAGIFIDAERTQGPARLRPEPDANVVVFADEAHAKAVLFADAFHGRDAWFHGGCDVAQAWAAVQSEGSAAIAAVTTWLERLELADPVLAWLAADGAGAAAVGPANGELAADPRRTTAAVRTTRTNTQRTDDSPAHDDAARAESGDAQLRVVRSEAAGVWYLARLVLELEMAEALWCVGTAEGAFLSHVVAAVLGGGLSDPAWRWFGGAFDDTPPLDVLPQWGIDEVRGKLERAFPPAVLVRLAAEVPPVTDGADAPTRGLISTCAAALCAAFCARLDVPASVATVRKHIMLPGRFVLAELLRVELAMELLDIDLRRAGLDFNPGHLPWLDRKVEIVFASSATDE